MTIKLQKEEKLNGEIWYYVWIDSSIDRAFLVKESDPEQALKDASAHYHLLMGKLAEGFPKIETIFTHTLGD